MSQQTCSALPPAQPCAPSVKVQQRAFAGLSASGAADILLLLVNEVRSLLSPADHVPWMLQRTIATRPCIPAAPSLEAGKPVLDRAHVGYWTWSFVLFIFASGTVVSGHLYTRAWGYPPGILLYYAPWADNDMAALDLGTFHESQSSQAVLALVTQQVEWQVMLLTPIGLLFGRVR